MFLWILLKDRDAVRSWIGYKRPAIRQETGVEQNQAERLARDR
jgi:hypothetical protein